MHRSPIVGSENRPENCYTVKCELAEDGGATRLPLTQVKNATQAEADAMADFP